MAHFTKVPADVLKHVPSGVSTEVKDALMNAGTLSLFKDGVYGLTVPVGNDSWKGRQTRLVGVWGGGPTGGRLNVAARDPDRLTVTPVSERPVAPHLWAYIVEAAQEVHRCPATYLEARVPGGGEYAQALPVDVINEEAASDNLGPGGEGSDAIIAECRRQKVNLDTQIAYILATAEHETAGRFAPVRECCYLPAPRDEKARRGLRYYPYYGRGYVQLTHERNYKAYASLVGGDLVRDPDLALQPAVALYVLVHGMMHGTFGARLPNFVNATKTDFVGARRSVNGQDRAADIARLAEKWLRTLRPPARR